MNFTNYVLGIGIEEIAALCTIINFFFVAVHQIWKYIFRHRKRIISTIKLLGTRFLMIIKNLFRMVFYCIIGILCVVMISISMIRLCIIHVLVRILRRLD